MIKIQPYGDTLKERLLAAAKDKLYNFLLADGTVRGVLINGTRMVNEMRANHGLGVLETLVLGHAYMAGAMLAAGLKGDDRISLQVECSGPIKGLIVEANAFGEVRGYLKNVPIPVNSPPDSFNLSPFYGAGFLSVTKSLQDAKQPFTGRVVMAHGSLAKDLAHYFVTSEQIPSAVALSVQFDRDGQVTGAGGLLLQAMPNADPRTIDQLAETTGKLPSLGRLVNEDDFPSAWLGQHLKTWAPRLLSNRRVEFMCHCNRERIRAMLLMLPVSDLKDMRDNGPFPVQIRCHHCNTVYDYDQDELKALAGERFADN